MRYYIKTGVFSGVILALFLILVQSTNEKFLSESLFLPMNLILLIAHIVLSNLYGRKIHSSNFTFDKAISEGMKSFFIALLIFTVIPLIYFLIYDAELPFRLHGYQEELLINAGEEQEVINRHREQIKNISGRSLLIKGAITTFVIYSLVGIIFNIISSRILRKAK